MSSNGVPHRHLKTRDYDEKKSEEANDSQFRFSPPTNHEALSSESFRRVLYSQQESDTLISRDDDTVDRRPPPRPDQINNWKGTTRERSIISALTNDGTDDENSSDRGQKKISWDMGATSNEVDPRVSPLNRKAQLSNKRLSALDLRASNPLEDEAEAAILNAIEQQHIARMNGKRGKSSRILPSVPDESISMFNENTNHSDSTPDTTGETPSPVHRWPSARRVNRQRSRRASNTVQHRRVKSVEETLAQITEQMKGIRGGAKTLETMEVDGIPEEITEIEKPVPKEVNIDRPKTQADMLTRNATILFRRSNAKRHMEESDDAVGRTTGEVLPLDSDEKSGEEKQKKHNWLSRCFVKCLAKLNCCASGAKRAKRLAAKDMEYISDFVQPKKRTVYQYCRAVLQWVFFPTLVVSFALYYSGNPLTCEEDHCASFSWWFIFLLIRQTITFTLALVVEFIIIDVLSLRNRVTIRLLGPTATLLIVQSKGWPAILLLWAVIDLLMLEGPSEFAHHWLFYQDALKIFNANNNSGTVVESWIYFGILITAVIVACVVALKRLWMGIYLGRRTYSQYGKDLAILLDDILLISLLASLGREFEITDRGKSFNLEPADLAHNIAKFDLCEMEDLDDDSVSFRNYESPKSKVAVGGSDGVGKPVEATQKDMSESVDRDNNDLLPKDEIANSERSSSPQSHTKRNLSPSQQIQVAEALGHWQEPHRPLVDDLNDIPISAILQFRQAISYMDDEFPFSIYYGNAGTRERCIASAQDVYDDLLLNTPKEEKLPFDTIALVAQEKDGNIDDVKLKRLYRLFHPDIDGNLSALDFVRSCDGVYRRLRRFIATIENASQLDRAFERIVNIAFYVLLGCIVLAVWGVNPLALFLSLSSVIVGFAFMIGSASSKCFEGIILILARKPYDIGDRIHVSDPMCDTKSSGASTWVVEKVDLFTTTVRFATTNEVATLSNGSLANARIINGARSPQALVYLNLKFGVGVSLTKIKVFQSSVQSFVKDRPREWVSLNACRLTNVEPNQGFIEYTVVLKHVESWQNVATILNSKADLSSYCLQLSEKLNMKYMLPGMPIKLEISKETEAASGDTSDRPNSDSSAFMRELLDT